MLRASAANSRRIDTRTRRHGQRDEPVDLEAVRLRWVEIQ
jgi:hypothetical protein